MNPILLKTLITLAASNNKSAKGGTVGTDAQLKNRTVLYPDEAVDLPEWGISGLPAMILGAAPQTCLFVSDLSTDRDTEDAPSGDADSGDDDATALAPEIASFSLTLKCPPEADSTLHARTIVWQLSVPIAGYRDVQTSSNSASVHAPVIKTRMVLRGVERVVNIGLLEMAGLDQPLLVGQDALADKFLIRPDRPASDKSPKAPSVDLNADVKSNDSSKTTASDTPSADDADAPASSETPSDTQEAPDTNSYPDDTNTDPTPKPEEAASNDPVTPDANPTETTADSPATAPDTGADDHVPPSSDDLTEPKTDSQETQTSTPAPEEQPTAAQTETATTSPDGTGTASPTTEATAPTAPATATQPTDTAPASDTDQNK